MPGSWDGADFLGVIEEEGDASSFCRFTGAIIVAPTRAGFSPGLAIADPRCFGQCGLFPGFVLAVSQTQGFRQSGWRNEPLFGCRREQYRCRQPLSAMSEIETDAHCSGGPYYTRKKCVSSVQTTLPIPGRFQLFLGFDHAPSWRRTLMLMNLYRAEIFPGLRAPPTRKSTPLTSPCEYQRERWCGVIVFLIFGVAHQSDNWRVMGRPPGPRHGIKVNVGRAF